MFQKIKNLSRKKKLFLIITILIIGFIGYGRYRAANQPPPYTLEAAQLDSITELVSETGNVTTAGVTPIYTTTTGMVESVFVQNGNYVAKDQLMFSVQATATKQEQDTALANYLAAKSTLDTAKATQLSLQAAMFGKWDSFKELAEGDEYANDDGTPRYNERGVAEFHVSEKEWLAAEAAYKKQQGVIYQAQAQVSATWQAYQATQDSQVKANFSGEVRNLAISRGDMVVGATVNSSPALLLVDNSIKPIIKLQVNENDALKISPGQTASVEFDAIEGQIFEAKVDRVDTIADATADVVTFSVYIQIENPTDQIRSGLTADVDITVANKENILTVPSSAIKPYQGGRAVRVVGENEEIEFIPVEIGSRGNGRTEILSGIEPGQEVIVSLANDQIERSGGFF